MSKKTYFQEVVAKPNLSDIYTDYSELSTIQSVKNQSYINWPARIKYLAANKGHTDKKKISAYIKKHDEAKALAGSWVTCACGNQCAIIPRTQYGAPVDNKLDTLGMEFLTFIRTQRYDEATKTLAKIEARSLNIIKDIKAKENV